MKKVLVIEDDKNILDLLEIHFRDLDCEIIPAYDGEDGLNKALSQSYDLIVLDLMLPKVDGLEICRQVRMNKLHTPILMLTAKSEEIDKVLGLETGADDYLTKPFSVRELIARVKVIFRRSKLMEVKQDNKINKLLRFGTLAVDLEKKKVSIHEKRVDLSRREFELLALLASNPGKSFSREQILNLIWGYDFDGFAHTVNSHINRLRGKIEPDITHPQYILTSWGLGYRFNEEL